MEKLTAINKAQTKSRLYTQSAFCLIILNSLFSPLGYLSKKDCIYYQQSFFSHLQYQYDILLCMNKEAFIALEYIHFRTIEILQIIQLDNLFQIPFGMNFPLFD